MGRDPQWVEENIIWFSNRLSISTDAFPKVWPIVQAHNDPKIISNREFEIVLNGSLTGKSTGTMMFTSNAVAQDQGKTEIMKKVYDEIIKK